ncbi:MAG: DUF512 domain-containing protein [Oscillospiraceae bacterium]|nr:DUF512 domain-containing protein [Oscillospiraceae bacterium]
MPVLIKDVAQGSPAQKAGIRPGMQLESINRHPIEDVLDYQFYATERRLEIRLLDGETPLSVKVRKEQYDDLGLEFETYLMDRQHSCKNKCVFCFVDQMPPGMRDTLYFKDDDSRLSFLFGNYITLTNMEEKDIRRIIEMHISPVNVSVHTTNPELRVKMMANPKAASSLKYLEQLAEGGVKVNTQIVLCPGLNDGEELERSLGDLGALWPGVQSVAVVPVGLTRYREKLYPLRPFTPEEAGAVIDQIENFTQRFYERRGCRLAYAADEFYLKAGRDLPDAEYYGEFSQLENGVGLLALLRQELSDALADSVDCEKERHISVATGVAAGDFIREMTEKIAARYPNFHCQVYPVLNDFFGREITVAGLVTGRDIIRQLQKRELGEALYIPGVMLRHEQDKFLDDLTIPDLERELGVPVHTVDNDGYEFLNTLMDEELF